MGVEIKVRPNVRVTFYAINMYNCFSEVVDASIESLRYPVEELNPKLRKGTL